jgi:hypothetical protein
MWMFSPRRIAIGSKRKAQQSEVFDSSTSASIQTSLVSPEAKSRDIFEMFSGESSLLACTYLYFFRAG